MVFENGVKNIQVAAYNGTRTVYEQPVHTAFFSQSKWPKDKPFLLKIFLGHN